MLKVFYDNTTMLQSYINSIHNMIYQPTFSFNPVATVATTANLYKYISYITILTISNNYKDFYLKDKKKDL